MKTNTTKGASAARSTRRTNPVAEANIETNTEDDDQNLTMNLFSNSASIADLRKQRMQQVTKAIINEQERLIADLKGDLHSLEMELSQTTDIGPSHTTSLRVVDNFNAKEFVKKVHDLSVSIALKQTEVQIAERNLKNMTGGK